MFCVDKVLIALFVEYPLCFLLCHNLRLHMLKTCSIGKTVLSVSCARFKSHICKLRPPPNFKTKKFLHLPLADIDTKYSILSIPGSWRKVSNTGRKYRLFRYCWACDIFICGQRTHDKKDRFILEEVISLASEWQVVEITHVSLCFLQYLLIKNEKRAKSLHIHP